MKFHPTTHRLPLRSTGFTLIELLVVITIIGILAAMIFPVANGVQRKAVEARTKNDAMNLRNAITTYFTEYRKFPVKAAGGGNSDSRLESNKKLMDVLMAADSEATTGGLNPRKISFFAGKKAKGSKGGVVMSSDGGGELFDPWGKHFQVVLDTNYNDRVTDPGDAGTENIPQSVIAWSFGPNQTDDNGKGDDIVTW